MEDKARPPERDDQWRRGREAAVAAPGEGGSPLAPACADMPAALAGAAARGAMRPAGRGEPENRTEFAIRGTCYSNIPPALTSYIYKIYRILLILIYL